MRYQGPEQRHSTIGLIEAGARGPSDDHVPGDGTPSDGPDRSALDHPHLGFVVVVTRGVQ